MAWPRILVGAYALFNILVALEAYLRVGSLPSLLGGVVVGALLFGCFFLIPKQPRIGYIGATVVSVLVAGRFLPGAFGENGKMWPNMVLGLVAVAVVIALTAAHFLAKSKSGSTPAEN